ncbi:WS/DGAT/MGAT family O-acyltransferase [Rhodococcus koreensis]
MGNDTLSFLDAGFLETEDSDRHASLTIGALAVIEGPPPDQKEFRDAVAERLLDLPHARDKLRTAPLDVSAPSWTEDSNFDLDRHLRRVAIPNPGEEEALFGFVARVMGHRLDRDHPLWECWVVEGLSGDRWAMLAKLHHCMADGITGTRLFEAMCDEVEPTIDPAAGSSGPDRPAHQPPPAPSISTLLSPSHQCELFETILRAPLTIARAGLGAGRGLARLLTEMLMSSSDTSLIGPIGKQRRYRGARTRMADVREICAAYGVTVNDVALAAITGGLRTLLLRRGEHPDAHTVRTLVPVSVRSANDDAESPHNQVSLMLPFLPVDIEDHVEQLTAVHRRMSAHKAGKEAQGGKVFTSLAQSGPFMPLAWALRLATRFPQHSVVAVATNIPGPQQTRHLLSRKIVDIFPYVPIALRLRVGIAILSYADNLTFGLTGDYDTTPDLADLGTAIEQGVSSLLTAARLETAGSQS